MGATRAAGNTIEGPARAFAQALRHAEVAAKDVAYVLCPRVARRACSDGNAILSSRLWYARSVRVMQRWWLAGFSVFSWAACSGTAVVDPGTGTATSGAGGGSSTTASTTTGVTVGTVTSSGAGGGCDGPGQCELTHPGCCPACGTPALEGLVAVPIDQLDAYHAMQCPNPQPCPDCIACTNGEVLAYCDGGGCQKAHLDDFDLRACNVNEDCRLRWGTRCFEACGGVAECDGLTAVNANAETTLADLACDPDAPPPPPCVPTYPPDAAPFCDGGVCRVTFVGP